MTRPAREASRRRWLCAAVALASGTLPSWVRAQQADEVAGRYELQGVREFVAALELQRDGRFEYAFMYGGAEGLAHGRWTRDGIKVSLIVDPPPPAAFAEGGRSQQPLGDYATEADKPTVLVVRVSTPRLGLTWSNMEIAAEFSNGLVRRGTTGRSGLLGFLQRRDEPWAGATVRRVSVAYPKTDVGPTWFAVDASVKGLEVHFEPGQLVPPAFDRAVLLLGQNGSERVLVVKDGDMARAGWRLVRR